VTMTCKNPPEKKDKENDSEWEDEVDYEWEIVPVPSTVPSDWEGELPFSPDSLVWRDAPEG